MSHIPSSWKIETVYKGVNIYNDDGNIIVVYSLGWVYPQLKHLKSVLAAKRWITDNKTYNNGTIQVAGRCDIDLRGDTEFY